MMWTLALPGTADSETNLSSALTLASGVAVYNLSAGELALVLGKYGEYDAEKGVPSASLKCTTLSAALLSALHDAYDQVQVGGRLSTFRDSLKLLTDLCPYCGFGEIKDLDHYLPRSDYKAFAIYARNLIPVCHPCNNAKRRLAGATSTSQFVHAYYAMLPDERYLQARASVRKDALVVKFWIEATTSIDPDELARASFQFEKLQLDRRYRAQVNLLLSSQRTAITSAAKRGAASLKQYLLDAAADASNDFGLNDWRTAMWFALAECDDFCDGGYVHSFGVKGVIGAGAAAGDGDGDAGDN